MKISILQDLPKHKWLERELTAKIAELGLKPHEQFLTEQAIFDRYGTSIPTIRQSLQRMVTKRLIYRVHGRGTFIAPQAKDRKILLVNPPDERNYHVQAFSTRLAGWLERIKNRYEVVSVTVEQFEKVCGDDLSYIYPDLAGVIFFRHFEIVEKSRDLLEKKNIPFLFYGSGIYRGKIEGLHHLYSDENEITALALDFLKHKGHTRIAHLTLGPFEKMSPTYAARTEAYRSWMVQQGLKVEDEWVFEISENDFLRGRAFANFLSDFPARLERAPFTALFCAADIFSALAVQALTKLGIAVPGDVAVIGVDNDPYATRIYPNLSSVEIPVGRDAEICGNAILALIEGGPSFVEKKSELRVVERESA